MTVYAHDDLLCRALPSSLKGAAYNWFYSLLRNSLWSSDDVTEAFYNQFTSQREFQKNNRLLTVKMRSGESLKSFVNYFQGQMALVYNYDKDVSATAFISGLQCSHPLLKASGEERCYQDEGHHCSSAEVHAD